MAELKQTDKALQEQMENAEKELTTLLCAIPNIPCDLVPEGKDAYKKAKADGSIDAVKKNPKCPVCGTSYKPGQKFCNECGTQLK